MTRPHTPENEGVLTSDDDNAYSSDITQDEFNKAEIERLGRQRPEILSSAVVEVGFVTAIIMAMMMGEFFVSGFNIVLPTVAEHLNIPEPARTWPAEVPSLTTGALLLPCARLCDRYGGRLVFLVGVSWLVVWSLICGFSQNTNMLIVCRAMQGLSTAAFLPAGISLLGQTYRPGPRKNIIFSLYGVFAVLGFYLGIALGALMGQLLDWRWYFWVGAILAFVNAAIGYLSVPTNLSHGDATLAMDWWGLGTIVPGLVLVIFAFTDGGSAPDGWRTPYVYVTLIVGVLFLAAAVYVEGWVAAQPLFPAELFRPKYMKRLVFSMFCCYGAFGLYLFYVSYYLSTVLHTTPLQTAAWFTPMALGGIFLAIMGGLVLHLIPGRILMIISGLGFVLSMLLFALIPDRDASGSPSTSFLFWSYVFPAMLCATIGVDITFNVTNVFITTSMPARLQATAGALINSVLYLGIAFWLGIAELVVSQVKEARGGGAGEEDNSLSPREQYKIAFWIGVALGAITLLLFSTITIDKAAADMTTDEKAQLAEELTAAAAAARARGNGRECI